MSIPYRVLQVVTVMNQGGAETMLMNHYRVLDRSKVQFDFLVCRKERGFFDDEIENLGGRIFRTIPIRPWHYLKFFNWVDDFFAEHAHEYVAVHSHIQENSGFVFKYAQKHGIRICIAHSHIAFRGVDCKMPFRKFAHYFQLKYSTYNLSCGLEAGKYLFSHRHFELFNNAIDANKYKVDLVVRNRIRKELSIENRVVLGSVARITWQKNHSFMLDVMSELVKRCPEALLVIVGSGDKTPEVLQKIEQLKLKDHVLMLGNRANVYELLQAFDVFFMPSLFEGLPVSVIEAQAAGLQCILSDTIDRTTDVTGNVHFVPLSASLNIWCEQILAVCQLAHMNTYQSIVKAGYDVHENVKHLLSYYGIEDDSNSTKTDSKSGPMITVGIPVWNAEKYIVNAIKSVLSQTYQNFELLISDDGSSDSTLSIVRSFTDPRIRIIEGNGNVGIASRLNEQIEQARGKYFARMDADDIMFPTRLERQIEIMEKSPAIDVLGTSIIAIDESFSILGLRRSWKGKEEYGKANYLLHPTIMARTKWVKANLYNPAYSGWEDYELWLRTCRFSNFEALAEPLLFYRDSLNFDIPKFIHRRMIGIKVVVNEWMYYDNLGSAIHALFSNLVSCVLVPLVHVLRFDKFIIRRRNEELPNDYQKEYHILLDKSRGIDS